MLLYYIREVTILESQSFCASYFRAGIRIHQSLKEIWNAKILFLLEESASRGLDLAQHTLAVVYKQGYYGVQKDLEKAHKLIVGAAKQGHMRSLEMLVNQSAWTEWFLQFDV